MDEAQGIQVLRSRYKDSISVGFTGTRKGMTIVQWEKVEDLLLRLWYMRAGEWHNGDCVGADHQSNMTVKSINEMKRNATEAVEIKTFGHPCTLTNYRAHDSYDHEYPPLPPMTRNRKIVHDSHVMLGTPGNYQLVVRGSGTWGTIKHTRIVRRPLFIVYPDASVEVENVA